MSRTGTPEEVHGSGPRSKGGTDWEQVYRAVYPDLLRFLRWMLLDGDQAKDMAQEAFARVLGTEADNPRGLVFRTAANLARDEARLVVRRKRHLKLLQVEADVRTEHARSPSQDLEERERVERVRRAMEALSERDRQVLLLWNAGLDYTEIAAESGLALGAVGTTVARAKRKLMSAHDALEGRDAALG